MAPGYAPGPLSLDSPASEAAKTLLPRTVRITPSRNLEAFRTRDIVDHSVGSMTFTHCRVDLPVGDKFAIKRSVFVPGFNMSKSGSSSELSLSM